jgi:hypothetical protein
MKVGMINKQGHLVKSWNNRHFVLLNGTLKYYADASPHPPYGVIEKGEHFLENNVIDVKDRLVTLVQPAGKASKKASNLVMEIVDESERNAWVVAFQAHIDYATSQSKK